MKQRWSGAVALGLLLGALVLTLFFADSARAQEAFTVRGGVYRDLLVCPLLHPSPCRSKPVGPVAGAKVVFRTRSGKLVKELTTRSNGTFGTALRPGEYRVSVRGRSYRWNLKLEKNISRFDLVIGQ